MKTLPCYKCSLKIELKRADRWTATPRYQKLEERPRMIRYYSGGKKKTYYVMTHNCKEQR